MGLKLTILGASGSYPGPGEACSGYLLRSDSTTLLIDAGSGVVANLQRHVGIDQLDAVVLTHDHPDHWMDLTGLYVAARYYLELSKLPVYAPAKLRRVAYYRDHPIAWTTVSDNSTESIGDLSLRFSRTVHPTETLAVRVDGGGRSFAYSADTGPGWSFSALGGPVDLALCEATFLAADENPVHLSARQAGAMAREAGARRLVLTHLRPGSDIEAARREGESTFGGPVDIARDNQEYDL